MHDIFLSYAREDLGRVRKLVEVLESQGWVVFWDRKLLPGQTWRSYISKALGESRCVVVAWSKNSVESTWVIEEAEEARKRGVLFPALLDHVDPPLGFRSIHAANLVDSQDNGTPIELAELVAAVASVLIPLPGTAGPPIPHQAAGRIESIVDGQKLPCLNRSGLPSDLQSLLQQVESEAEQYPDRRSDLRQMNGFIENGNFDMARYMANDIANRQQQLRSARSGLPSDLQSLLQQVESEAEQYPDRRSDLRQMNGFIENGNFDMARYMANDIVNRQQQLRSARSGLPPDLQSLLQQVESEAEQYPDRRSDLEQMNSFIENGNFEMARYMAEDIVTRQRQLRSTRGGQFSG